MKNTLNARWTQFRILLQNCKLSCQALLLVITCNSRAVKQQIIRGFSGLFSLGKMKVDGLPIRDPLQESARRFFMFKPLYIQKRNVLFDFL